MKSQPFKSSDLKDEYYNKLAGKDKSMYWDIFAGRCKPTAEFKGNYLDSIVDLI